MLACYIMKQSKRVEFWTDLSFCCHPWVESFQCELRYRTSVSEDVSDLVLNDRSTGSRIFPELWPLELHLHGNWWQEEVGSHWDAGRRWGWRGAALGCWRPLHPQGNIWAASPKKKTSFHVPVGALCLWVTVTAPFFSDLAASLHSNV